MWHTRTGFQAQAFHPGIYVQPISFEHPAANIVHISPHGHAPAGSIVAAAAAYSTVGQDFNLGAAAAALSIEPRMIVGSVNYSRDLGTSTSEAHFSSLYGGRLTSPDAVVAASRSREAQQLQAEQGLIRSSASFAAYSGGEARLQISAVDHQDAATANLGGASLINIGSGRGAGTALANYDQGGAGAAAGSRGDTNIAAEEELESSLAASKVGRGPLSSLEEQAAAAAAGGGASTAAGAATAVQLQGTSSRLDLHRYHHHQHHHDGQEEDSDHQGLQLDRSNIGLIQHHHEQHRGTQEEEQQQQQQHNLLFSTTSLSNATTSVGGGRQRSSSGGSIACHDCGNQAKKDCQYSRCRTCCKSRGFDCATHVKSTWVPAAKRRERQQAELAALVAGAPAQPRLRFKRTRQPAGHPHHVFGAGPAAPSGSLDVIGGGDTSTSTGGSPPRASSNPDQLHRFNSSMSVVPLLMQPPPPQAAAAAAAAAASSQDQTSKMLPLPPEVRAQAVFKCVKVTGVSDGHDEYAYQTVVKIGGRIFKGMLFDQGSDTRGLMGTPSSLAELQLGARNAPSTSGLIDLAAGVYGPSGSGLLGDLR